MPLPVINAAAPLNTNDDANGPSAADALRNANTNHVGLGRSNSLALDSCNRNGGAPHDEPFHHQGAHLHFNWNDLNTSSAQKVNWPQKVNQICAKIS